ncbi:hypothetical protein Ct61P_11626 [Colletotrichum tofieldiae]|nr:hypothetical protein Ct61P_11626 [Colletotrichum tofieldiae]
MDEFLYVFLGNNFPVYFFDYRNLFSVQSVDCIVRKQFRNPIFCGDLPVHDHKQHHRRKCMVHLSHDQSVAYQINCTVALPLAIFEWAVARRGSNKEFHNLPQ